MSMMICDHAKVCGNTHCTVGMPHEELVTCRGGICGDKLVHCIPVPVTEDESRARFLKWMSGPGLGILDQATGRKVYFYHEEKLAWEAWQEARKE